MNTMAAVETQDDGDGRQWRWWPIAAADMWDNRDGGNV